MLRLVAAGLVAAIALAGCSSGGEDAASTTTVTTTTLPQSSTTTTVPPRSVTEVDVCGLLRPRELELLVEDPGTGEAGPTEEIESATAVPALITGSCSWPSAADPQLVLNYLAPTTAADGPTHLQDVLATDTRFAEGGQVITQQSGQEAVGLLVDGDQQLREAAVVKRSALLYLFIEEEVSGRDTGALQAYADLLVAALVRAPR